MLELRILGGLDLRGPEGERRAVLSQPKRLALLVYLVLARPRGFHRRDTLLHVFWPDAEPGVARNALGQAVHFLRRELGTSVLIGRGREELGLAAGTLWCDAIAFEEALERGRAEDARGLYQGELLRGFHLSAHPELERWLEDERSRLARAAADLGGPTDLTRAPLLTPAPYPGARSTSVRVDPPPPASVAVLPFLDLSPAGEPHLAEGLADDIISALATINGLRVTSRTSSFAFKDRPMPVARIGEELGVATVVEGSIRAQNGRVRVTAQLLSAATESRLWSGSYDRTFAELFAVQREIVEGASQALRVELSSSERARLENRAASPEAFHLYLRGRYHAGHGSSEGWDRAVECYRLALEADTGYALAYAGLADAHLQLPLFHFLPPIPRSEALDRAKVAAARAVALDDELGEAHAALGVARWYDWDWDGAERSLRRALMLNPAAASVRQRYGLLLTFLGRFDEAARELRRATTLDPLSLYVAVDRGVVELRAGRLELAVAHFQKVLDLRPGFAPAQHYLAEAYAYDGRVEASLSLHMQRGLVDAATGEWMRTLIRSGQLHEYFAEWAARAERSNASPAIVACAWARAGEIERGWEWLDRAVAERDPALTDGVRVHPGFNPYRGTPRFAALLRQMRVEERFGAAPSSW